jgi:predicted CoA-binding protein
MSKKTLVLGASVKPDRYSNKAVRLLRSFQHDVLAVGAATGQIEDVRIEKEFPENDRVHTLTLYLNPDLQKQYYENIIALKPLRIIFNPGTENEELKTLAEKAGIKTEDACTLVLLNTGQY